MMMVVGTSSTRCFLLLLSSALVAMLWSLRCAEATVGGPLSRDEHVRRRRLLSAGHDRRLVSRGTPTGGGKYPFLAVVEWDLFSAPEDRSPDPRDATDIWCNGVMVAPDVLLTSVYCRPNNAHVMVGDSPDRSPNAPIQFPRVIGDVYRDAVAHMDGWFRLFKVEPVTFPGFVPVVVNNDKSSPSIEIGQNLTVVSYGPADSLRAYSYKNLTWPGEALEGTLQITRLEYPNGQFWTGHNGVDGVGVCMGDYNAPVLDSDMKLVALAWPWSCGNASTLLWNIAYFADFIERNTCAMSSSTHELSFCPDLVCPTDARVMGYPFAELPNATDKVKGIRGFVPTRVTQWPPPGTVIGQGTTSVTLTATNASNYTLECVWTVFVPPLEVIGKVEQELENGTSRYSRNVTTFANQALRGPHSGAVYKMRSVLAQELQADLKRTWVSYGRVPPRPPHNLDGDLTMLTNQSTGAKYFANPIQVDLTDNVLPNLTVETELLRNLAPNNETVLLYGQVEYYQ